MTFVYKVIDSPVGKGCDEVDALFAREPDESPL